jgi:hypothetical protein
MLCKRGLGIFVILIALIVMLDSYAVEGAEYSLSVSGTDAIFLAGREDITIPALGVQDPSFPLERYPYPASVHNVETFPMALPVRGGDQINVEASGLIRYYSSWGRIIEAGPDGREIELSDYQGVGGISGYKGPHGALLGIFLNDDIPSADPAPTSIDFSGRGIESQFDTLYPALGQVFFIGDGYTDNGSIQNFAAPAGATRILFGVADGRLYTGIPGYYENNIGSFDVIAYLPDSAITATVDLKPNKLVLRNRGRYITAFIELGEGYDAREIKRSSVMITEVNGFVLKGEIQAIRRSRIGDRDEDGVLDLKVKFSRRKLVPLLSVGANELTIIGVLNDGTAFEGFGEITAKAKKPKKQCKKRRR